MRKVPSISGYAPKTGILNLTFKKYKFKTCFKSCIIFDVEMSCEVINPMIC